MSAIAAVTYLLSILAITRASGNPTDIASELSGRCLADLRALAFKSLEKLVEYFILACGSRRHDDRSRRSTGRTT